MSIVIAILIFGLIILFHEFGHFLLAKKNDIRVEEFCIGFGPKLWSIQKGETQFSIRALPLGGACVMTGEDEDCKAPRAFGSKSLLARFSVVVAGPAFNFLLAFILAVVMIGCIGIDRPIVSQVEQGGAAQQAGMEAGDRIVKIGSEPIVVYREAANFLSLHPGMAKEEIPVVVERNGEKTTLYITPQYSQENGRYLFGFSWDGSRTRVGPLKTLAYGAYEVKYWIQITIDSLRLMVTGQVSAKNVSGPVGIVSSIGSTYRESIAISVFAAFINMLNITILLSANLGVMNLLPIPALDGGRLLFLFVEAVRRKRVDPDKEGAVNFAGFMILMGLMVLVFMNDIHNLLS